ncbi:vexin [Lissotriton helveticus]
MNQIYSRGEDNLEVFTTVMSPKMCRASRGRTQHSPQTFRRSVAAASDVIHFWPDELLPCPSELIDILCRDDEVWRFGRLQNGQKVLFPVKYAAKKRDTSETRTAKSRGNHPDENSAASEAPPAVPDTVTQRSPVQETPPDSPVTEQPVDCRHRNTTEDQAQPEGTDASFLLERMPSGTPSILKKMWMRHKKKAGYLGAKNGAFEAD